jgi:hypothetical protein
MIVTQVGPCDAWTVNELKALLYGKHSQRYHSKHYESEEGF